MILRHASLTDMRVWITAIHLQSTRCSPDAILPHAQDAASDLYGIVIMSPTNYTRRAVPRYETYGVPTEFSCVPPTIKAPFNKTEFEAYF